MTAKTKVRACVQALKGVTAEAPVQIGDVILADMAETGVDIIATKKFQKFKITLLEKYGYHNFLKNI